MTIPVIRRRFLVEDLENPWVFVTNCSHTLTRRVGEREYQCESCGGILLARPLRAKKPPP